MEWVFGRISSRNLVGLRITGNSELGIESEFTSGLSTGAVL